MSGVTSAPEEYHRIIRNELRCCGVIANDLIVLGYGVEQHGKHLFAVLDRLSEVGLTVNKGKCVKYDCL